jgi:hypothetical protein
LTRARNILYVGRSRCYTFVNIFEHEIRNKIGAFD